jgi:hypothetical protein
LRAEQARATDPQQRALLLHELGVVEERSGDEMGAAREFLAAFNSFAQFREPLEGLVRLLERRKSVKNLPKLLDALVRAADSPEERTRAFLKRAGFWADYKRDDAGAKASLEQALRERPEDATLWLELEVLAGRTGDVAARADALAARAELEKDPTWRALLLLGVAELVSKRGEGARAIQILEQATSLEGSARYRSALALERQAARDNQPRALARALEAQAEMVVNAQKDAESSDALGVPASMRVPEAAADAWLRAADARRHMGDLGAAAALLDRALEKVGPKAPILAARLSLAEVGGDTVTAERIAETLLDQGLTGPSAASLFMRVAEAAAQRDDAAGALAALSSALASDPGCIPARALQIDLLGSGGDGPALAAAIEAMANELPSDAAKARAFLLSAYVFALHARDVSSAKLALSQAGASGLAPGPLARTGRLLATLTGDGTWYEEATRRLLAAGATEGEHRSLWFELGRTRLLRSDEEAAARAFESLAQAAGGGWLGRALGAYALGREPKAPNGESAGSHLRPEALDRLREEHSDPSAVRALALAAARRADLAGDSADASRRAREVFEADSTDIVAAVYLAELEKRGDRPLEAARVLAKAGRAVTDSDARTSLHVEAAILFFRGGERSSAIDELEAAFPLAPTLVSPLLRWALRATLAGSTEKQRKLLERAAELSDEPLLALERSALELLSGQPKAASPLLQDAEQAAAGDLSRAATLGRILCDVIDGDTDGYAAMLEQLESASPAAAPLLAWERLRLARLGSDRDLAVSAAHALADASSSPPAQLEWLGAAIAKGDVAAEVAARRALASSLSGEARSALLADAALVALFDEAEKEVPLLAASDGPSRLMNLELAPAGENPGRRAAALGALGDTLGDEAKFDALLMSGYNLLAHGQAREALACFHKVTAQRGDDLFAWEGVRSAAEALAEAGPQAEACASLGALSTDNERAALFWEQAAVLRLDKLSDAAGGELALEHAFTRDSSRTVAFDRLFRRVRQRGESEKLLGLIARRLEIAEEPDELAKLFWERARALRQLGDRAGALAALEHVTMIEPDHVGALALKGEIEITQGNFAAAAESLSRLAELGDAPPQQRLLSGVAAVDLYENKLNDPAKALEVLIALHQSGLSTLPVRERMARAAAKVGSWDRATEMLHELMHDRTTAEGRVEAARLAMAIFRDKLHRPLDASHAVAKLLDEAPDDAEALELVLEQDFDPEFKRSLLVGGRVALVEALTRDPIDRDRVVRLARIVEELEDWPLRQATLGVLSALSGPDGAIEHELSLLDARVAKMPRVAVDESTIALIGDPDDTGALAQLFATLAEPLSTALGPSLEALGAGKKQRIEPRSGLPIRNEIAAWAGALGLGEFDLYVGGKRADAVQGVPGERPAIVVGSAIAAPLAPAARQAVVRELFALRRGTSIARTRDETTVAAIVVAACRLAEVPVEAPPYAMLADVQRQLGKALSRRTRKLLPPLCRAVVEEGHDPKAWAASALVSMYRMAAIAAGDVSLVLRDVLDAPLDRLPSLISYDERARRLMAFVLSPRYLELRGKLGMGVT